jgi:hypothetical protein
LIFENSILAFFSPGLLNSIDYLRPKDRLSRMGISKMDEIFHFFRGILFGQSFEQNDVKINLSDSTDALDKTQSQKM